MVTHHPKLDSILQELSAALRGRYGDRYVRLWLYGSEARGEAHAESDVDVLLVLREVNHPTREIDHIADILADFNLRYGVLLSILPVAENTLKTAEGPFWRNVRREGIAA
ncbi:MAG: nucleotidyltransferase domain-containing protein [Gammaproteobacteria bacterium]|nr:MAG: nucleotidyltransferase domain-containing protein [Gammaproteobacteria bacterium]